MPDVTTVEASDAELVRAFLEGDSAAFEELFRRHERMVRTRARRFVGDPDLAAELTQEAFLRLVEQVCSDGVTIASVAAWLTRVVTNLAIDELRRRRIHVRHHVDSAVDLDTVVACDLVQERFSPERAAEQRELAHQVRNVLTGLPERQRVVLLMRSVHRAPGEEIAHRLGCTVQAVDAMHWRARRRFRAQWTERQAETDQWSAVS